jgi:hypothetical protein
MSHSSKIVPVGASPLYPNCRMADPNVNEPPPRVGFYDARGRFLKAAGGALACKDGVVTEPALFRLQARGDGTQAVVLVAGDGSYVGAPTSASSGFPLVALLDAAQAFDIEPVADAGDGAVALKLAAAGAAAAAGSSGDPAPAADGGAAAVPTPAPSPAYLAAAPDGAVAPAPDRHVFTLAPQPLLAAVTAAWVASPAFDGRAVSVWGGPDRGWVCPHPPKMFGGGEVKSRVPRMGQWELFHVRLTDPAARRVALRSVHDRWLCVTPDGGLVCDKKEVGMWEQLALVQADALGVALVSRAHHGGRPMFVCAEDERMHARAGGHGPATRFLLFDAAEARKHYHDTNPSFRLPPEKTKTSALAFAGMVGGALLGAAALATAAVVAVAVIQAAQEREDAEREKARLAKEAAQKAAEEAEAARLALEDASSRADAETRAKAAVAALREAGAPGAPGDGDAVLAACSTLNQTAVEFISGRQAALGAGGPAAIVAAVARHVDRVDVLAAGVNLLTTLATTSAAKLAVVGGGGVKLLADALKEHGAADAALAHRALALLSTLCDAKEGKDAAVPYLPRLVAGLKAQTAAGGSGNAGLQAAYLTTLRDAVYDNYSSIAKFIDADAGGVSATVAALRAAQPSGAAVMVAALRLLNEFTRWTTGAAAVAKEPGAVALILEVMASPAARTNTDIAFYATSVVGWNMCWEKSWPHTKDALLAAGAPAALATGLQTQRGLCSQSCSRALAAFVSVPALKDVIKPAVPALARTMAGGNKDATDAGTVVLLAFSEDRAARRAAQEHVPAVYKQMLAKLGPLPGDSDALLAAAHDGDVYGVREALDRGAKTGAREKKKAVPQGGGVTHYASTTPWVGTALHVAARQGKVAVAELLLERGADAEEEASFTAYSGGDFGIVGTPLDAAVFGRQRAAVELLLDHGATVTDQALSLAADQPELLAVLREAKAGNRKPKSEDEDDEEDEE